MCAHMSMHTYTYTPICLGTWAPACICAYIPIYLYTYIPAYICAHTSIYIYIYARSLRVSYLNGGIRLSG